MNRKLLLFFYLISLSFNLFAQNFHSELEKSFFSSYEKDSVNYNMLLGLCVIDSTFTEADLENYQARLERFIKEIPQKEVSERREKKRIRKIYKLVHNSFLRKYDVEAFFTDIFKKGYYNCVTATALYAYIFDELNIPYHIKEVPAHVYLVAYPKSYKIHIETTVPGAHGLLMPTDSEIRKMVDELLKMKLVDENEISQKGYKEVYYSYYYGKDKKEKHTLIGMQYYNKSLFDYNKGKMESAFQSIIKSTRFYHNPFSNIVLKDLAYRRIDKFKSNNKEEIESMLRALQYVDFEEDDKYIYQQMLYKITEDDANDLSFINEIVSSFEVIEDQKLREYCLHFLYTYLGLKNGEKHNFKESIYYSKKLLKLDSKNNQAKDLLIYSIYGGMVNLPFSEKNLLKLEDFFQNYPFLNNDKRTVTLLAAFNAQMALNNFVDKKEEETFKYLDRFEKLYNKDKELVQLNSEYIAQLYLKIGRFYYGQSKFEKALEIFERGLVFYPEHLELKKMKKWAIEDMK